MRNGIRVSCSTAIISSVIFIARSAAIAATPLTTQLVVSGLTNPVHMSCPPGDSTRMFIVEKAGRIRLIKNGVLQATPFLDVHLKVDSTTLEWGMLGLTFHPDYQNNGYFYVNYSKIGTGDTIIARYRVTANPDIADNNSEQIILNLIQPSPNHRGGWLAFGPDGYLYDSQGDGGGQQDPSNRAQNIELLQGKILRLDVNGPDGIPGTADDDGFPADPNRYYRIPPSNPFVGAPGADEIWAYGLRNPWKCSFDRDTGDIWIGDVGQFMREEIDVLPFNSTPPLNFGWRCMEAELCTGMTGCTCNSAGLTPKVYSYAPTSGHAIIGGYVYRGCVIPDLRGTYFFAEYQNSHIWSFRYVNGAVTEFTERTTELDPPGAGTVNGISVFGEDNNGEIYLVQLSGSVWKIIPATGGTDPVVMSIKLVNPLPPLVSPCTSLDFDVKIETCNQPIQTGSELLHYRFDGGAFQTAPLTPLGGPLYRATLPAANCGSHPEFYLSGQTSTGSSATYPTDAPAHVLSVAVGTGSPFVQIAQDFESGLPAGWSATGLWHVSGDCIQQPVCSGAGWAYYGQEGACNYDAGATSGLLTAPAITLPSSPSITLMYCSNFEREGFANSDWPSVRVNSTVVDEPALGGRTSSPWEERTVDLTQFAGQTVTLSWQFATGDAFGNTFRGWQVDNMSVIAIQATCDAPASFVKGDMDASGSADGADIPAFVAAALGQSTSSSDVCAGDFTGDGRVSPADVAGFVALLLLP